MIRLYDAISAVDPRSRPSPLARFVALILVLVVFLSTVSLIVGDWYRQTILSVDWYRPIIESESFQDVVRDSIMNEVSKEIGQTGIFAALLTQAMDRVLTNDRIETFLETYLVHLVDYLNGRTNTPMPADASELFRTAFLSLAEEASHTLGVPLPSSVETQIAQIADQIGQAAEANIDLFTQESFAKLAAMEKYHRTMLWISQSTGLITLILGLSLLLLLLLFARRLLTFFFYALIGVWLTGAAIALPLLAFPAAQLGRAFIDAPSALQPILESLVTLAVDQLKTTGLIVMAGATVVLIVLLLIRWISRRR